MTFKLSKNLALIMVLVVSSYLLPCCFSDNFTLHYQVLDSPDGSICYRLNVAVPQSLYEYYSEKSRRLGSSDNLARFVTPYTLQPIADSLWEIYGNEEDFANGVLMLVHQIPYNETLPVKYPVETMVEKRGDCDLFSYVAVSILKAGGVNGVLLYYESEDHMNIGVHLSDPPEDARSESCYVRVDGVRYYVAECTGGEGNRGWRVGECPDNLKLASAKVVTLEECEEWGPGQVSASYETLEASAISLTASSYVIQGKTAQLSGQLSPALQNQTVTLYIKVNNFPWSVLDTVTTGSDGRFVYAWRPDTAGVHCIRASWSGNKDYGAADSSLRHMTVISVFFFLLLAVTGVFVCVGTILFLMSRPSRPEVEEPRPPQIPK